MRLLGIAILAVLSFCAAGPSQEPAKPPPVARRWSDENLAMRLALSDLEKLDPVDRLFTRYVWLTGSDPTELQATALAMNYVSRASVIVRPFPVFLGWGPASVASVLRVDLRNYAPKADAKRNDLQSMVDTWEELRFDPRFNLLLTVDTIKFAAEFGVLNATRQEKRTRRKVGPDGEPVLVDCAPYVHPKDGKTYTKRYVEEDYFETVPVVIAAGDVVREVAPHLDKAMYAKLVDWTRSQAPVVSNRYFVSRALTTIQDKGVFKTVYGGLYYQFSGVGTKFKKGTDEDNLFESLGVGNVEAGVTAKKLFDELRSDRRVALFRSGVTGKPRRVDFLPSLSAPGGIISVTHDPGDADIDIGQHPMMNLLDFKAKAREEIWTKANGLHGFALFNDAGVRQDEVPPDVAHDHQIPAPYTRRLQPAISCIRCHRTGAGWQPAQNDVKKLLAGYLDAFNDTSNRKASVPDVVDRLAGLYAGDVEFETLPAGRRAYAGAVLRATGPWRASKEANADAVVLASDRLGELYKAHHYEQVDAARALAELGFVGVDPKDATATLRALLPPVKIVVDGVIPEDARIGALTHGLAIPRTDWDLVYAFAAARAQTTLKAAGNNKGVLKP